MRLCVYAIMRDEQANVAAWAETTGDADTRFVLDTGSTDTTASELEFHGVGVRHAVFDPFRFDDARNAALALAPEADLYLRLDADERLPDDWRAQIAAVYDPNVARYRYRVRNTSGVWGLITRDDLHRRGGFRWKYPTHEVLVGAGPTIDLPRLIVEHTHQGRRPHHDTNFDVLYHAVQEYPNDPRMIFYLGRECWYEGRWEQARQWMVKYLDLPDGWAAERCEAYRILAFMDTYPERWLWKAIGEAPERRQPWVDLTRHFLGLNKVESAVMAMNFAHLRSDDTLYTTDPQCWGEPFGLLTEEVMARGVDDINAGP